MSNKKTMLLVAMLILMPPQTTYSHIFSVSKETIPDCAVPKKNKDKKQDLPMETDVTAWALVLLIYAAFAVGGYHGHRCWSKYVESEIHKEAGDDYKELLDQQEIIKKLEDEQAETEKLPTYTLEDLRQASSEREHNKQLRNTIDEVTRKNRGRTFFNRIELLLSLLRPEQKMQVAQRDNLMFSFQNEGIPLQDADCRVLVHIVESIYSLLFGIAAPDLLDSQGTLTELAVIPPNENNTSTTWKLTLRVKRLPNEIDPEILRSDPVERLPFQVKYIPRSFKDPIETDVDGLGKLTYQYVWNEQTNEAKFILEGDIPVNTKNVKQMDR